MAKGISGRVKIPLIINQRKQLKHMDGKKLFGELGIPYPCSPDLEGLEGIVPDGSMVDCQCEVSENNSLGNQKTPEEEHFFGQDSQADELQIHESSFNSFSSPQTSLGKQEDQKESQSQNNCGPVNQSAPRKEKLGKTKKISKGYVGKKQKIDEIDGKSDTKNILSTFKKPFVDYISGNMTQKNNINFNNFKKASPPNMKTYQDLFNDESLRPIIAQMFLKEELKRSVQLSRASLKQKCTYIGQINVFKRAFLSKKFTNIR